MKALLFAFLLLPSALFAQSPPVQMPVVRQRAILPIPYQVTSEPLSENYQITLMISDKDGQPVEISVVVASTQFNTNLGEQSLSFSGSVAVEEGGSLTVAYALGWQTPTVSNGNTQYSSSSVQGSVRLKLGDEVQIIKAGSRTARLSIKKLEQSKSK